MLIEILGFETTEKQGKKKGTKYNVMTVNYKRDGKTNSMMLMDFKAKEVYDFIEGITEFPMLAEVQSVKNDRGYWDWEAIKPAGDMKITDGLKKATGKKDSNVWEEKDRRIIRQSSLDRAVTFVLATVKSPTVGDCLAVAEEFAAWVVSEPAKASQGPGVVDDDDFPL